MLREWIVGHLEKRQEDRDPKHIGLSQCGKCPRQLAYKYHLIPGIPLSWRAKSIFDDGNLIQDQLRQWIHLSEDRPDCYWLADEEEECSLMTPKGRHIIGHTDGVIHHTTEDGPCPIDHDGSYLLEIKSMSAAGWRAFKWEGLEKSYVAQVCAYLKAFDLPYARVLIKCKDDSDLQEVVRQRDDGLVETCLARLDEVFDSKAPDMVQRLYGPEEDGALPWQCRYCAYWEPCWEKLQPKLVGKRLVLQGDYLGSS